MAAGHYNIVDDWGATLYRSFLWEIDGVPVDLTGYRARMEVRDTYLPSGVLIAAFTTVGSAGLTIPTPANGTIVFGPVDRTDLADVTPGKLFVYDLFVYVPSGVEYRLLYGTFLLRSIVTEVP